MTPQQTWYSLPVPYAHRPRPTGSRPRRRDGGRQLVLTAGAIAAGVLIVVVLVGRAVTGPAAGDPDGLRTPQRSATPDGDAAFVDAYVTAGLPDLGGRDAVLRVGRATCANRGGGGAIGPDGSALLSPADAQRVAELARLHLCVPGRTG